MNYDPSVPTRQSSGRLLSRSSTSAWGTLNSMSSGPGESLAGRSARVGILGLLLALAIGALELRLWSLQVIQGKDLGERSENNRIRLERMRAPRGRIFDRNGVELVTNRPAYNLLCYPEEIPSSFNFDSLASVSGLNAASLRAACQEDRSLPRFQPRTIAYDLSFTQVARIEARLAQFGGLSIEIEPRRYYRFGQMAAHALGTVGVMNQAEWAALKDDAEGRFVQSDYVGKTGIEKYLNDELSGHPGYRRFESDAQGRKVAWIDDIEPQAGNDVVLNLDFRLQMIIEEAFGSWKGAVFAMDPRNGEVLAFHSAPSFDPNLFAGNVSAQQLQAVFGDPAKPLLNRVSGVAYQPGSVFKTVSLLAGLKYGAVTRAMGINCTGTAMILGDLRHCWKPGGHGYVHYREALINSCNIFFYNVGLRVGIEPLGEIGHAVGFGQKSGIELLDENSGIMPTPEWKERALGQPWWKGETISVAIGQGMLQITPLQAANLMATVATGVRYKPRLVREFRAEDGRVVHHTSPDAVDRLDVRPEHLAMVRDALAGVVEEGTGKKAKNDTFPVAGKTGTAQVVKRALSLGDNVPEKYRDHNWFVCYVSNGQEPVLAMTLFLENGGKEGMAIKAELAGQIIAAYMPLLYPERAALFAQKQAEAKQASSGTRAKAEPKKPVPEVPAPAETEEETPVEDVDD
jgi:penicillin-binding protein 2